MELTLKLVSSLSLTSVLFFIHSKAKIKELREKIDAVDNEMLDMLIQCFAISKEIGNIKADNELNVAD